MKETNPQAAPSDWQRYVSLVAILVALGLGIAYASKTSQHQELQTALSATQTDLGKLAAREKQLSGELAEARNQAQSSGTEAYKAREEIKSLSRTLSQAQEQARDRQRKLEATIASLNSDLAAASERAEKLATAIPPDDLKAIDGPKPAQTVATKVPTKEAAEARNKELLKKFIRISDDFERPKVYMHGRFASLRKDSTTQRAIALLCNVTVTTEGVTTVYPFKSIRILVNDDVITFADVGSLHQFVKDQKLREEFIKCRLAWEELDLSQVSPGSIRLGLGRVSKTEDITLDFEDFVTPLKETYELAASFEELKSFK